MVAVLVGEQEGLRGKDWWEREIRKYFVFGNLMVSQVIRGMECGANLKFEFAVGV